MRRIPAIVLLVMVFAGLVVTAGCDSGTQISRIADINRDQRPYLNTEVVVLGTVVDTLWSSGLNEYIYVVNDGSGTINVLTSNPPPSNDQRVRVKGKLEAVTSDPFGIREAITEEKRQIVGP